VVLGLTLAIVLSSASQLCWKYATMGIPEGTGTLQTLGLTFSRPTFFIAAGLFVWQFFNWMAVLKHADLSFAQPIMAGTYIVVGAAAWLLFEETLPPHRLVGILLILSGVVFISRSPYRSAPAPQRESLESELAAEQEAM
jgi:drug/metabolite transporter (DMT)-like permease